MSHPSEEPLELKPRLRRPFELSSDPPTPDHETSPNANTFPPPSTDNNNKPDSTPSRNRSFLNLTASTLFGIYAPSGLEIDTIPPTPVANGTQTPLDRGSFDFTRSGTDRNSPSGFTTKTSTGKTIRRDTNSRPHKPLVRRRRTFTNFVVPTAARIVTLFAVGMLYGGLIYHLHDQQNLAPATVALDRGHWAYYVTWGIIGVVLGEALPWADTLWAEDEDEDAVVEENNKQTRRRRRESWLDAVRSIGLFVGIAFAIRKLPWQSTLQLSLTLALTGPAVWYLIDRSPSAFFLSSIVAVGGTVVLFGTNPRLLPGPTPQAILQGYVRNNGTKTHAGDDLVPGVFRMESVGVAAWIASVLFVSAVCFGNVGRRLGGRREL